MRIYIDDGSTNIKMLWEQDQEGEVIKISPNSFKRGWGTALVLANHSTIPLITRSIHSILLILTICQLTT